MKNSKRIVTLILALVMVVSTMGISTFAATFSDIADERVASAVEKLVANGIITGYDDGTYRPENQITRAEFAAVVTRMKGVAGSLSSDAVTGFSDLDNDEVSAWARPYVKAAVDLGIINGFDDGTFRATEPVTYEQAVKMLVCAAGYDVVAQSEYNKQIAMDPNASWSAGYIIAANKHGFTKGAITALISEPASRGVVAILTSNTLDVPPLVVNQDGSVGKSDASSEEKTVEEVTGIVSGTYYTGIEAPTAGISLKEIKILTANDGEITYELSESLANSVDFEDLIGTNVTAYYNTLDRQLTSIKKSKNIETTINEKDIIRPIVDGEIKYYKDNKKSTSVNLDDYTVIYNGKYIPSNSDIIDELEQNFKNGSIELIEAAGRKFAKITSYDVYVVDSFSRSTGKINFKYNAGYYTFPASTDDKPEIYVDGTKKAYDSLTLRAFNVINFREAPEVGGNYANKMYVTTKSYSGKITAEIDKHRTVELNNKEVVLTNVYNNFEGSGKAPFSLGETYKYYLDYTGQIAAVDYNPATSSDYSLGYIIDADDESVILINSEKTISIVPLKSRVKVDGKTMDDDAVKDKLVTIATTLYGTAVCSQPVKYVLSDDGELSAIDTAADSTGAKATAVNSNDDAFVYNAGGSVTANKSSLKIDGTTYQLSNSTVVVYVPENTTSDADYSIMAPSKAFAAGGSREVKIFGADPGQRTKQATMVLIYGVDPAYHFIASTPYMVVSSVNAANQEITGFAKGATSETTVAVSEERFKLPENNDGCVSIAEVAKGDIIRYIEDATGVIAIEMVYDADGSNGYLYEDNEHLKSDQWREGDVPHVENDRYFEHATTNVGELGVRYAEAFDIINESQFVVTKALGATEEVKQQDENLITYKINSSTTVYRIDEEGNLIAEPSEYKYENIEITEESSSEVIVFITDLTNKTAKAIYIVD